MTFKKILSSELHYGDIVIDRITENTLRYLGDFDDTTASVQTLSADYTFRVPKKYISKFRMYMIFELIGRKFRIINRNYNL